MEWKTALTVYLWIGPAYGLCVLLWGYGEEFIVRYYERFHLPRLVYHHGLWLRTKGSGKKVPTWVIVRKNSPERGKHWVLWVYAFIMSVPLLNLYFVVIPAIRDLPNTFKKLRRKLAGR